MTWCYLIISPIAGAKCICHLHDYDSVDVGVDVDALMRGLPHEGDRPISPRWPWKSRGSGSGMWPSGFESEPNQTTPNRREWRGKSCLTCARGEWPGPKTEWMPHIHAARSSEAWKTGNSAQRKNPADIGHRFGSYPQKSQRLKSCSRL